MSLSNLLSLEWNKFRKLRLLFYSFCLFAGYFIFLLVFGTINKSTQEFHATLAVGMLKISVYFTQLFVLPCYLYFLYLFYQTEIEVSNFDRYKLQKFPYVSVFFLKVVLGFTVSIVCTFLTVFLLFFSQRLDIHLPISTLFNHLIPLLLGQIIQVLFAFSLFQFMKSNYVVLLFLFLFSLLSSFDLPYNLFYFVSKAINVQTFQGEIYSFVPYMKVGASGLFLVVLSLLLVAFKTKRV